MPTRRELATMATILAIGLVGGLALIQVIELLRPALGYDFALIAVSISLPPIGLVGMLVEDAIRSGK